MNLFRKSLQLLIPMNDHQYIIIGARANDLTYLKYDSSTDVFSNKIKIEGNGHPRRDDYISCAYNDKNKLLYI